MWKPRPRKSGLSLAELLVALGLFAVVLVLGLSGLRLDQSKGRSQSLANEVKGLFHRARAQAVSTGVPVALVFPTSGGSTPVATECAILSGQQVGKLQRELSFDGNFPEVGVFIGEWALPAGQTFEPPLIPTGAQPPRFQIGAWLPADLSTHAAYVFLPSGQLVTNGQLTVAGEYPVVVASRLTATPGGSSALLSAADDAFTVLVSDRTTVRVEAGVLGGEVPSGGGGSESWTLGAISSTAPAAAAPEISAVEVLPAPIDTAFAASQGAECVVEQGGVVTLRVKAGDANGGPLYCQWTADQGGLSHPAEVPMLYSPEEDAWVSEWHWTPPVTANVNDIFQLEVNVRDESGSATAGAGVVLNPRILIVDRGILAFSTSRDFSAIDPDMRGYVFTSRYDGTNLRAIAASTSTSGFEGGLSPSRDGRRIAIGCDYGDDTLRLISSDGAEVKTIVLADFFRPYFSPDSTKIYLARGTLINPSGWTMHVITFDAAGNPTESPSPFGGIVSGWSPDGTKALIQTTSGDIRICDATTGAVISEVYSASAPGGPAIALDWNSRGIFYGNAQTETAPYPSQPGTFDIHQEDIASGTNTNVGTYYTCADLGGDGRYVFHIGRGIHQDDLTTGTSRLIVPGFVEPAPGGYSYAVGASRMWQACRNLSSSN